MADAVARVGGACGPPWATTGGRFHFRTAVGVTLARQILPQASNVVAGDTTVESTPNWPLSNPNVILGCTIAARVAGIRYAARLNQQKMNLTFRICLVFSALGNDKHLTGTN